VEEGCSSGYFARPATDTTPVNVTLVDAFFYLSHISVGQYRSFDRVRCKGLGRVAQSV
jgi:hypothetical protein